MYILYIYGICIAYVIYTTSAALLYQIYKHEPKASGCAFDTTRTLKLYIGYDTHKLMVYILYIYTV